MVTSALKMETASPKRWFLPVSTMSFIPCFIRIAQLIKIKGKQGDKQTYGQEKSSVAICFKIFMHGLSFTRLIAMQNYAKYNISGLLIDCP
jgi:hypothetical protein